MTKRITHNKQKQTRTNIRKNKKRKGLKGLITPAAIYYIVARPIIDIVIAAVQSGWTPF